MAAEIGTVVWRRLYRALGILVLSLCGLTVGSYALVPWAIKSQLPKLAEAKLGRALDVGEVTFKPWLLDLRVNDLALAGQTAASPPMLKVSSLHVTAAWASLWRLAPVVDAIHIEAPKLHIEHQGSGRYDFDDLLAHLAKSGDNRDSQSSEPTRFALYNVAVTGGEVDFVDTPFGGKHVLRDLKLGLPFLSSMPIYREVNIQPELSFVLNGGRFASTAQSKPFAASHASDIQLKIDQLDVKPYLTYLPKGLPVQLTSGVIASDLQIGFEQGASHVLRVSGGIELKGLGLVLPSMGKTTGDPLLNVSALRVKIKSLLPFEQHAHLELLELAQPTAAISRNSDGSLPLLHALSANTTTATAAPGSTISSQAGRPHKAWTLQLDKLALTAGSVAWRDASTAPEAQMKLSNAQLMLNQLSWPIVKPVAFTLGGDFQAVGSQTARLDGVGTATDKLAEVKLQVSKLDLAVINPYLARWLNPFLAGQLNSELKLNWRAPTSDPAEGAQTWVEIPELTLDKLALMAAAPGNAPIALASVQQIKLGEVRLNLAQQDLSVGSLALRQLNFPVDRAEDGRWMAQAWLKTPVTSETPSTAIAPASPKESKPWKVALSAFSIDDAHVPFTDKSTARPVRLDISALKLKLNNMVLSAKTPVPIELEAKVSTGKLEPGTLTIRGNLLQEPLGLDASIGASRLPLHALARYLTGVLDVDLLRADTSFKGQVNYRQSPSGPVVSVKGDAALEDFRANTKASRLADNSLNGDELLSWKALGLRGVAFGLTPGSPMQLVVRETVLSDFYARLILREDGQFNLQDLSRSSPNAATQTAVVTEKPPEPKAAPAQIRFGGISLVNGKVFFTDHFIKPHYSADLSELTGRLGAFSSQALEGEAPPQMADLELRGRAEGTATLEILGKLNPLAKPLAMDIKGKVRELELPPLSAYSLKYAGYAIERGKLSLDVGYLVLPTGELTASNKLILNSLQFGDKAEGSTASLPVKLAVALLADRNGVIDLEIPISGSLNDPQFQLSSVIFKVIGNIVLKAISSPFSLLAGAFGGGEGEISNVSFPAGSSRLTAPALLSLDQIAKVMEEKTNLTMTVIGTASLSAERDAYQRERLQALVQAEQRRAVTTGAISGLVTGSKNATENIANNEEQISGEAYETLLKRVYRRANIVKPRNLLGLVKDIPVPEMEALLLANMSATQDQLKALALQRAVVVKDYLASRKVASSQLFLGAAKTVETEGKWTPRAELNLSTR